MRIIILFILFGNFLFAQSVINAITAPQKTSGLAYDGNFLWSGAHGVNGYVYTVDNPLVIVNPSYVDIEETKSNIRGIVDFFLGKNTIAEHYITGRFPAELMYYHGDRLLPDEWWGQHKLLISLIVGLGVINLGEIWEYYWDEKQKYGYSSPFDVIRRDPDTHTDMTLALCNLALFASEIIFPPLEGLIRIEIHSPILKDHLNPLRGSGFREEVIYSSKYISFGTLQLGIVLGHGEPVTEEQKRSREAPSTFYRVFGPRKIGLEYVPGGPPIFGSYCGLSVQHYKNIGKIPIVLSGVVFTSEQKRIAFRIGVTSLLKY